MKTHSSSLFSQFLCGVVILLPLVDASGGTEEYLVGGKYGLDAVTDREWVKKKPSSGKCSWKKSRLMELLARDDRCVLQWYQVKNTKDSGEYVREIIFKKNFNLMHNLNQRATQDGKWVCLLADTGKRIQFFRPDSDTKKSKLTSQEWVRLINNAIDMAIGFRERNGQAAERKRRSQVSLDLSSGQSARSPQPALSRHSEHKADPQAEIPLKTLRLFPTSSCSFSLTGDPDTPRMGDDVYGSLREKQQETFWDVDSLDEVPNPSNESILKAYQAEHGRNPTTSELSDYAMDRYGKEVSVVQAFKLMTKFSSGKRKPAAKL